MAFDSAADLAARFDERIIADLASDTGEPVADITSDTKVTVALEDGAGRIVSALTVARMYDPDDLAALTGYSLALLKRINCELAMSYLIGRRQDNFGDESYQKIQESAEDYLERIRKGERLFDIEAAKDAGLPEVDGPSTVQYRKMNLIPDRTSNFYPERATRLPLGRY